VQHPEGCWEGEMVWCTMILSQYVIVRKVTGRDLDEPTAAGIIRHYEVARNADGSWGLHPESAGYVFTTTLAYVALRLLGLSPDHPLVEPARRWLHQQPGGVLAIPTWGKIWLALIDLYDWDGVNPAPPELFLLPPWLPVSPWHLYCHTRYIYLAISYLFGKRFRGNLGRITLELRWELYDRPFGSIDFSKHRSDVAASDLFVRPGPLLQFGYRLLAIAERLRIPSLRRRALDRCLRHIVAEQRTSRFQGLSPVNALLNCLALFASNPDHPDLEKSLDGIEAWKWQDDDGIRYAGAQSQTWDTAFAVQAILSAPGAARLHAAPLRQAYRFLRDAQMSSAVPPGGVGSGVRGHHRDPIDGGWCFSDGQHRWPVSDCTAEALTAILQMHPNLEIPDSERISDDRLSAAVRFILQRQNADGGFGTYERRRGPGFLERLNPSEMYGQCMTEQSYLECTASCVGALSHYLTGARSTPSPPTPLPRGGEGRSRAWPPGGRAWADRLRRRIEVAIRRGIRCLRRGQRADGSFPGFWGINFTYGIWHVVKGLRAAGIPASDPALVRAAGWLKGKQRPDGGWGEHYSSCLTGQYVEHPESQAVMTSWALLALLELLPATEPAVTRGIDWLRRHQQGDGSWPQQAVNGVFFGTAMLDYRLYRSYFPAWAMARWASLIKVPGDNVERGAIPPLLTTGGGEFDGTSFSPPYEGEDPENESPG
jgi:lanosterol synthase